MSVSAILLPLAALVIWTLIMLAWMAFARVPTMVRLRMHPQKYPRTQDLASALPPEVQWKADNYNHLLEQPTLFYATVLALAVLGNVAIWELSLAWAYVATWVVHSLVHAGRNQVLLRFRIFGLSSLVLLALVGCLLVRLIGGLM